MDTRRRLLVTLGVPMALSLSLQPGHGSGVKVQDQSDTGIVFVSMRDGIEDIYVQQVDAIEPRRVTTTEPVEGEQRGSWVPAWSPDRTRIAFASNRDDGGSADIYVVDVDGTNIRRLTNNTSLDYTPDWSPDGTEIAFLSNRDGFWELYVMEADGSKVRRLTHLEKEENGLCCPDWTPDGRRIIFMTLIPPRRAVVNILDIETGAVFELGSGALPRWSPDGQLIAYFNGRTGQVHVMRADGTDRRQVSEVDGLATYPAWSPDGKMIVFNVVPTTGDLDGTELYVVNVDGSNQRRLTHNEVSDGHPNWW